MAWKIRKTGGIVVGWEGGRAHRAQLQQILFGAGEGVHGGPDSPTAQGRGGLMAWRRDLAEIPRSLGMTEEGRGKRGNHLALAGRRGGR